MLFNTLRPGQSYSERWQAKLDASGAGLLVEEGILCGVGETSDDIAESIMKMRTLAADQVRVMSFVPQPGTPLAGASAPSCWQELVILAVMRLAFPDRLIPGSLDVAGAAGLRPRLEAGANVITSCILPDRGYTGVAQAELDIDTAARMPPNLMPLIEGLKLRPAAPGKFKDWMTQRRRARRGL